MAGKSRRKRSNSIYDHKGQAVIELILISVFLLGAILSILTVFQGFEKDSQQYLMTKELK